ncbi:MarR family transcriptional regulator [Thalassotalea sp. M1531]|uniref:MarR family transcriptional regulator n=1 Tax=Thalassotalea algicola TaxID=2716224 RepID=A0A7Y0LBH0_9GAMM|nr:MarR family transcriptional regulator [Thalassotalea algicola]NMP31485.1 MarR family transcriptional regulator [Thalassotalea algicola]
MSDNLALEKQLCFRLYSLNKNITKLYAPLLKELGLTYPQYLVMLALWQTKESVPIKALCNALDLDTGTISPLLKRMEQASLISRVRNPEDERSVTISLTAHGKHIKQKAKHIPMKLFALTGLSSNEMQILQSTLDKLLIATKQHL